MSNFPEISFTPKRILIVAVLFIIVFIIVSNVRDNMMSANSYGLAGSVRTMSAPQINLAPSMDYASNEESAEYASDANRYPVPPTSPDAPAGVSKIIKNAELTLLVDTVDVATQLIERIRIEQGGQPGNSSFGYYAQNRTGDITIWVPSDRFDVALRDIKKGALQVTNERISIADVSAQYVDLEARLKNMRATESQYLEILKRSGSIPDVLSVTRELSQTRQTIEQLQGQLNYLSRQIALSSIHIQLTEEVVPTLAKDEWRPFSVIKSASRETLRDLTHLIDAFLVFVIQLPLLLLQLAFWAGILYGLWRIALFVYARVRGVGLSGGAEKL